MPLPVAPADVSDAEGDRTASERFGVGPAEEGEKSPVSAEGVSAVASASDFLVVPPEREEGLEEKLEPVIEASMDAPPMEESVLAPLGEDPEAGPMIEERGDAFKSPESAAAEPVSPEPEAPEAAAPEEEARPGNGKNFVFGNAAEELELAVARMRRGEVRQSPGEGSRDPAES